MGTTAALVLLAIAIVYFVGGLACVWVRVRWGPPGLLKGELQLFALWPLAALFAIPFVALFVVVEHAATKRDDAKRLQEIER